jgi:hypothetical protein
MNSFVLARSEPQGNRGNTPPRHDMSEHESDGDGDYEDHDRVCVILRLLGQALYEMHFILR